jgi:hypothetical protein
VAGEAYLPLQIAEREGTMIKTARRWWLHATLGAVLASGLVACPSKSPSGKSSAAGSTGSTDTGSTGAGNAPAPAPGAPAQDNSAPKDNSAPANAPAPAPAPAPDNSGSSKGG